MNRTLKEATVKRYHYERHEQLREHLQLFVDAYDHARRLKTLRGLTPYEYVCSAWTKRQNSSELIRYTTFRDHTSSGPLLVIPKCVVGLLGVIAARNACPSTWASSCQ